MVSKMMRVNRGWGIKVSKYNDGLWTPINVNVEDGLMDSYCFNIWLSPSPLVGPVGRR